MRLLLSSSQTASLWSAVLIQVACGCSTGLWYDAPGSEQIAHPACKGAAGEIYVVDQVTDFQEAKAICVDKGGNLASIHTIEENRMVQKECGERICWIGLYESTPGAKDNEDWMWTDGSQVGFMNWQEGEPNNHEGRDEEAVIMNLCGGIEDLVGFIFFMLVCCGLPLGLALGEGCSMIYAVYARNQMLPKAKAGQRVEPPSPFFRYCCGSAAVFYWEGCSTNYFITYCLWPWFSVCCWNISQFPIENGQMVGAPQMVSGYGGYGAPAVVGKIVQ